MKTASCLVALLFAAGGSVASAAAPAKPNFIVINIDDLGYADISPFGGKIPTPQLDRMAREGRKLTSHYAAPVCSPSRAALMTGCYPKRVLPIPGVLFPGGAVGLNPEEVTIAEVLKGQGYATACFGKWHLGDQPEFLPTRQGFDTYFGIPYSNDMGPRSEGAKSNLGEGLPKPNPKGAANQETDETGIRGAQPPMPLLENEKVVARVGPEEQRLFTGKYTERATKFIREHRDGPFFIYLPHNAVHFPHYPSPEFTGKSGKSLQADWVLEVDASVGKILDTLRELKLDERTLVIFTSDNGGPLQQGSDNGPLRGGKGSTLEGGMRVCTLAWWPGQVPAGTATADITAMIDVLPTLAALAGANLSEIPPAGRKLDGRDVRGSLLGIPSAESRDVFHYFRGPRLEAVRRGPWKLHLESGELYNLADDIGEAKNVAGEHADVVAQLRGVADAMDKDLGVKQPGPGVRPLGRVENPLPLIGMDGKVRPGFE
jgi:arylsulfatase A